MSLPDVGTGRLQIDHSQKAKEKGMEHLVVRGGSWRRRPHLVSPLVAPANIMVSLPLQFMKATVLAESSCFHLYLSKLT